MATICVNKNSVEYQTLLKKSGLPEFTVEAYSRHFLEKYDRFPHLDELPGSDSSVYLRHQLKLRKNNSTNIQNIIDTTGKEDLEQAIVTLNDRHRDLEVSVFPLEKDAIVDIKNRPSRFGIKQSEEVWIDDDVSSASFLNASLEKLASLYGIKFIPITTSDLQTPEWEGKIPDGYQASAFVYNGNIYINTDIASIDAPLHEMMHLFVGSVAFTNPTLYNNLIQKIQQLENFDTLAQEYRNRTRNDISEEILVREVSRYLTGFKSALDNLTEAQLHDLMYDITRLLDSILFGSVSTKQIEFDNLLNMSLKQLAKAVNSAEMNSDFQGSLNDAEIHRVLANVKSDLLKEGRLEEYC